MYFKKNFSSISAFGQDGITVIRHTFPPWINRKLDKIYKVFRHWTIGSTGLCFLSEEKQRLVLLLPQLSAWNTFQTTGQGGESKAEHWVGEIGFRARTVEAAGRFRWSSGEEGARQVRTCKHRVKLWGWTKKWPGNCKPNNS